MINVTTFTSSITVKDLELEAVANSMNIFVEQTEPPMSEEDKLVQLRLALNEHFNYRMKELTMPYVNKLAENANIATRAFLMSKVEEALSTNVTQTQIPE